MFWAVSLLAMDLITHSLTAEYHITGIRSLTLFGTYQYRRTKENPNNITRMNLLDLEKVAKERNLEWIIDDNDKYLAILKKEKEK